MSQYSASGIFRISTLWPRMNFQHQVFLGHWVYGSKGWVLEEMFIADYGISSELQLQLEK